MVRERILIVDDDDSWLEFCRCLLVAEGFSVDEAHNGAQAFKKLEQSSYDVVLTDLCMPPPNDGRAVVIGVKARRPETDAILMTASPTLETAISVLKDGAYDYIIKPFSSEYLKAVLGRCLEKRRSARELTVEKQLREELEAAYAEARRAQEIKEGFLARVSHELNTPLAQALFAVGLLEQLLPEGESKLRTYVGNASVAVRRLQDVVGDLLDFVDLQRPEMALELGPVSLDALFAGIEEGSRKLLEARQIRLSRRFAQGLPPALGDERLLGRAFRQLFLNAIHFNAQAGALEVTADERGDRLVVHVRDEGEGIAAVEREKCFDPFYQIAGYMTRKVGGLGLGLAIVKKIVEAHQGEISVESQPGKGTDFRVCLPKA